MALITRFEDIEGWQKARELTRVIYQMTAQGPFARDFTLKDQIRRSGVSSMANIAEGFEREGNREFVQFLAHSKGSAAEVKSHLYVALDAGFINESQFQHTYHLANETGQLIGGFIRYLESSPYPGRKFRRAGFLESTRNAKPETQNEHLR